MDECIGDVQSSKFLGVVIDSHLNWSKHINYIKTKVSKGIGIINRIEQFINKETLRTFFNLCIRIYTIVLKFGATRKIITGTRLLSYRRELCALFLVHRY